MDFASEFVVENYEEEEEEDVPMMGIGGPECDPGWDTDDDEFGYEACIMEFDDDEVPPGTTVAKPTQPKSTTKAKVPTNTVKFPMKIMIQEEPEKVLKFSEMILCKGEGCEVVLSHIDKPLTEGSKTWQCQFCGHQQDLAIWPNFEDKEDILYIDTPEGEEPPLFLDKLPRSEDDVIIFVIDTSGSMSLPVKGTEGVTKLKFHELSSILQEIIKQDQQKALACFPANGPPPIIDQGTAVREISRLQTVKAGLIEQLREMPKTNRVGLVTFSTEVVILGDCTGSRMEIPGHESDRMDYKTLQKYGEMQPAFKPLSETLTAIEHQIMQLNDDGQTSLGPALTVAISMIKESKTAKVILCTDGIANFGLGKNGSPPDEVNKFYDEAVTECKLNGLSVSIVSFDDCGLKDRFGSVPNETGGQVEKVSCSQANFKDKVKDDLNQLTYATQVYTRMTVNKDMYLLDPLKPDDMPRSHNAFLGNINLTTVPCYSFAFRPPAEPTQSTNTVTPPAEKPTTGSTAKSMADTGKPTEEPNPKKEAVPFNQKAPAEGATTTTSEGGEKKAQPFQYEVSFTTLTDVSGVRVWSKLKPVTKSVVKAQEHANTTSMVDNHLIQASKDVLSNSGKPANLNRVCLQNMKTVEKLRSQCSGDPVAMDKLTDFREKMKTITMYQRIDDDTATELRKIEKGQS